MIFLFFVEVSHAQQERSKTARHVGFPKADKVQKGSHHLATFNMSDPTPKSLNKNKKTRLRTRIK